MIPDFGPKMKDVDERDVEIHGLYHQNFKNAKQEKHAKGDPVYWNFLEMEFHPIPAATGFEASRVAMNIRNLVDEPSAPTRGSENGFTILSTETGRLPKSKLPNLKMIADADVVISTLDGKPVLGARTNGDGTIQIGGLVDVEPGTRLLVASFKGIKSKSKIVESIEL